MPYREQIKRNGDGSRKIIKKTTSVILVKDDGGFDQGSSYGDEEEWSESGNILKLEPSGFPKRYSRSQKKQRDQGQYQGIGWNNREN